jgi:antitoxin FitA
MASITLRDLPTRLHQKLKASAKKHRRSLNSELIALLEHAVEPQPVNVNDFLETARRFRSMLTFEASDEEISEAKRKGRL